MPNPRSAADRAEPSFVSRQVSDARRFYLNLKPDLTRDLVVVCGGVERVQAEYRVDRRSFPYYALELVSDGRGRLELDGKSFSLKSGSVFAYGPSTVHTIENGPAGKPGDGSRRNSTQRMRKYYVDFAGQTSERLLQSCGLLMGQPVSVASIHELIEVLDWLDRDARSDAKHSPAVCADLLRLLCSKIRQHRISDTPTDKPGSARAYATYTKIRATMDANYLHLRTIEDVAQRCDVSPIHISRLFRRFSGGGAYQFLLKKRMNHAAEMLLEERLLVKEVAERLRFSDPFQFSRAFKRVYGISPKQLVDTRSGP